MFNLFKNKKLDNENETETKSGPQRQFGENQKSVKKEPAKPWGRRERLIVGTTLLLSVLSSAILAMYARSWKLPNLPRLELKGFEFLSGERIILEGDGGSTSKAFERSQKVVEKFKEQTGKLAGVWGLYVYDIKNDFSFGINENEEFQAASLIKLPLIAQMYNLAERGEIVLNQTHTLSAGDKVGGAGSLYLEDNGTQIGYEDLIKQMANKSDNTAFRIAIGIVGEGNFQQYIKDIGMTQTNYDANTTIPSDIGRYFKKLYGEKLINPGNTQKVFEYLTKTAYENWLVAGIPEEITVAHKYGREIHVVNDAGVVFANDPYIVVIMSKGVVESEADKVFPVLSKLVYEEFK